MSFFATFVNELLKLVFPASVDDDICSNSSRTSLAVIALPVPDVALITSIFWC